MQTFHKYLTPEEERVLLRTVGRVNDVYAKRDLGWIRLILATGIRIGACSQLTVGDARAAFADRELTLRADIQKGKRRHSVPLTRDTEAALKLLLSVRRMMGRNNLDLDAPLILGRKHAGLSVRQYQERMRYWAAAAGLPHAVTPHWLRHTVAKRVIATSEAREPLLVAQRVLGHADIRSTAIYTQPDKEAVRAALEGMRR